FQVAGDGLDVTSPKVCPPGHYLLFLVNRAGVPSVAKIIQVTPGVAAGPAPAKKAAAAAPPAAEAAPMDALALREAVHAAAAGTKVVVGLTGTCPYGISACWGGAYEALQQLDGVELVDPIPDGERSTATVFLVDDRLPAVGRWQQEFHAIVNDSYQLRGVEVTVSAQVVRRDGRLVLVGDAERPDVPLVPLHASDKVQWDRAARTPLPAGPEEADAYDRLAGEVAVARGQVTATVTGPLTTSDTGQRIEVREFAPAGP
ncbi:MAG: galactose oxidase-like domain-containing protein, partial [Mycobacterium sp.]